MSGGRGGDRGTSASAVGNRFGRPSASTAAARTRRDTMNSQTNRKPGQVANYPDADALGTIGAIASKLPGPAMAVGVVKDMIDGRPSTGGIGNLGEQKGFVDRPGGKTDEQNRVASARRRQVARSSAARSGLAAVVLPKGPAGGGGGGGTLG